MDRMQRLADIAQSYTQAPWRKQLQFIGLFSLVLVLIALVASIYLNISARSAAVGRDIQSMQKRIDEIDQEIEDLQSELAFMMSADEMEERTNEMGFYPLSSDQLVYMTIPGYVERLPAVIAPYSGRVVVGAPVLPPEYTESVFDWLKRQVVQLPAPEFEVQP
jgi:cell division protein FtsL